MELDGGEGGGARSSAYAHFQYQKFIAEEECNNRSTCDA